MPRTAKFWNLICLKIFVASLILTFLEKKLKDISSRLFILPAYTITIIPLIIPCKIISTRKMPCNNWSV